MYRYRSRILRYLIQFYRIGVLICGIFARIYGPRSRISATGFAGFDHRFTFVDTALFATPVILFVGHGPKIPSNSVIFLTSCSFLQGSMISY